MPGNTTRTTLIRQWELLRLLPRREAGAGKTARQLADALCAAGYQVSKRQVERDLADLSNAFPIDCNDTSMPYGWRWMRDAALDIPGVTLAEAMSLHLIEATLKPLLPVAVLDAAAPRFQQAARKLASLPKHQPYARWPDKVRSVLPSLLFLPPKIDAGVLERIQSALLDEVQIEVCYRSMEGEEPRVYTLHPLALVQRGPITYLVASTFDYEDVRLFALHRFIEAEAIAKRSKRIRDFDLDRYISSGAFQFGSGKPVKLRAKVDSDLARILTETPISEDQKIIGSKSEDRWLLTATVASSWQLRWWVLSQGDSIEVIGPTGFRRDISETCRNMANQYHA